MLKNLFKHWEYNITITNITITMNGTAVFVIFELINPKGIIDFMPIEPPKMCCVNTKSDVLNASDLNLKLIFRCIERNINNDFEINSKDAHIEN